MAEFDQIFANDPNNPQNVAENGVISIYAPGTRTLIPLKTVTGGPLANPLQLNSRGFGPAFIADGYTLVAWEAVAPGEVFQGTFKSYAGILEETVEAKDAAQGALGQLQTVVPERVAAEVAEVVASGVLKGEPGKDGSNVVPTAQAIAAEIQTPGTPANTALSATIAVRATVTKPSGSTVASSDLLRAPAWSSDTDFLIPVAAADDISAGSEFMLTAAGKGDGRVVAAEENLFPFPDAVAGYSGGIWQARGTTSISVASGVAPGGADAIRVTATGTTFSGGLGHNGHSTGTWLLPDLGLKVGDVISARAWLAPPAGQNGRIQIRFYRGGSILSEPSTVGTVGTGARHANGVAIPDGATHFSILSYTTAPSAGATCDIAEVRIARGIGPISEHIDGGNEGGVWWGVPHQSPSSVGRVLGDPIVPSGGRSQLRYEGGGLWRVTPLGTAVGVLRTSDTLAVDRDNGQQGMFAPSAPFSTSDTAVVSGRIYVTRVAPSRDILVQGIGFRLTTPSASDDPCSVGLYSAAGAQLVTSGAVTGHLNGSGGMRIIPVAPTLLKAGAVYYVAFSAASTAAVRRGSVLADAFGAAIPALESGYAAAHPIPASLPALTATDAAVLFVLREFA